MHATRVYITFKIFWITLGEIVGKFCTGVKKWLDVTEKWLDVYWSKLNWEMKFSEVNFEMDIVENKSKVAHK